MSKFSSTRMALVPLVCICTIMYSLYVHSVLCVKENFKEHILLCKIIIMSIHTYTVSNKNHLVWGVSCHSSLPSFMCSGSSVFHLCVHLMLWAVVSPGSYLPWSPPHHWQGTHHATAAQNSRDPFRNTGRKFGRRMTVSYWTTCWWVDGGLMMAETVSVFMSCSIIVVNIPASVTCMYIAHCLAQHSTLLK